MPGAAPQPPAPPPPPAPMVFDQQTFMGAIGLLRDQKLRGFRIDIETQSTIAADEAQERADASEMIQAVGAFMQSSLPMMESMPAVTPLVGKMLLFLVRRFGIGVEMEGAFEDAIAKLEGNPGAAMQNPRASEAAMKMQMLQATMGLKQQEFGLKADLQRQEMQQDAAEHQMALEGRRLQLEGDQVKAAAEIQRAQMEDAMAARQHARETQLAELEHQHAIAQMLMPQPQPAPQQGGGMPMQPARLPFGAGVLTQGTR